MRGEMRGVALNARRRGPGPEGLRYSPSLYHMDSETPLPPSCSDGALRRLPRVRRGAAPGRRRRRRRRGRALGRVLEEGLADGRRA